MVTIRPELSLGTFLHCLVIQEGSVSQLPDRISLYTDTPRLRQHYVLEDLVQVGILNIHVVNCILMYVC